MKDFLEIKSEFQKAVSKKEGFKEHRESIKSLIEHIIPEEIKQSPKNETLFIKLIDILPIVKSSPINDKTGGFSFTMFCTGIETCGAGRFVTDMLQKRLLPNRYLPIESYHSMKFKFLNFRRCYFYIADFVLSITKKKDSKLIKEYIDKFIYEVKINLMATKYTKRMLLIKGLTKTESLAVMNENLSFMLNQNFYIENNAFDHMQNLISKLYEKRNIASIKENLNRLMTKRPRFLDRNFFEDIYTTYKLFNIKFLKSRNEKYVKRLISFFYLFKKNIILSPPDKRHINIKLIRNSTKGRGIVGVIISINFLYEGERFLKNHFMQALDACIEKPKYLESSYVVDKTRNGITLFIEIEKKEISNIEFKNLTTKLPIELEERIETVVNPIFMPQNYEEVLRNVVFLNGLLKSLSDIPQVITMYEKQTTNNIFFTVILVRILKENSISIEDHFKKSQTTLRYISDEIKNLGMFKKKYQKEANIFKISIKKKNFYTKNFSLDLEKAKKFSLNELSKVIGPIKEHSDE